MKIELVNLDSIRHKGLESGRIVNVRVIERKINTAVIDINGLKTEASIEAQIPDSFLALIELDQNSKQLRLRVLNHLKGTKELSDASSRIIMDNIRSALLENHLPENGAYIKAALDLFHRGVKLDPALIKLLVLANTRGGEDLESLILNFIGKGLVMDSEFIDFFQNLKGIYKKLLERKKDGQSLKDIFNLNEAETPGNVAQLTDFFRLFFGNGSGYFPVLLKYNDDDVLMQTRKEKTEQGERYYFDCSGKKTGDFLIIIDTQKEKYDIQVFLNPDFFLESKHLIQKGKPLLLEKMIKGINGKGIHVEFKEYNKNRFWLDETERTENKRTSRISGLDISV